MQFATCSRKSALGFLKKLYPDSEVSDTPESAGPVLDYVEQDIIRIPDPYMHGSRVAIYPSKNWREDIQDEVHAALKTFHEAQHQGGQADE